jgi:signal recognition particle subunit SRP54
LRIAKGSGTSTTEVNSLLERFKQMQVYLRQMSGLPGLGGRMVRAGAKRNKKASKKARKRGR